MAIHESSYKVILTFGKYKGLSLGYVAETNRNYLEWLGTAEGIPSNWATAANLTLVGEPVESLGMSNAALPDGSLRAQAWLARKNVIGVRFDYNPEMLARFKAEIDGRKWNAEEKHWEIPVTQLPTFLNLFGKRNVSAPDDVKKIYKELIDRRVALDEIRVKEDSEFEGPKLLLDLRPYQKVALEFFDRAGGRVLCADQMGLGKTAMSIAYARHTDSKCLIICPKSVIINWEREIKKFTGLNCCVWEAAGKRGHGNSKFHIINYDIVERNQKDLKDLKFDMLVCDEATLLKNRKTKRTQAILGFNKKKGLATKYVIFLTGTPIMNRPIEAFTLLNFLDKNRFNNFFHFTQKYGGWKGEPPRNLDDLNYRIKDVFIRRLKTQVQKELPPKQRENIYVELSPSEMKAYNQKLDELFRKWRKLGKPTVAEMPAIQNFLFDMKMPRVQQIIDELLENEQGVLIFSSFRDPLKKLLEHYGEDLCGYLDGTVTGKDRQQVIDDLAAKKKKIGLFSINAGGLGIDSLQYAISDVIMIDRFWVPAIHTQAEDRAHRSGQTEKVNVYYMTCVDTIDEYMDQILTEKQKVADQIVDGDLITPEMNKSYFKEFIFKLKSNYIAKMKELDESDVIDIS